jgi:hypothetical protein
MLGLGTGGRASILPLSRDDRESPDDPLVSDDGEDADEERNPAWRFGPLSAGLLGLGVGQLWFRASSAWVLYDSVSLWIVPIGTILIAGGAVWLARRAGRSPDDEGISGTQIAWIAGVVGGAILGLVSLLLSF